VEASGEGDMAVSITDEILRSVREISNTQVQQQRVTDQQATLIRQQEETLSEAIGEIEDLLLAVRGSVDGSHPSIHEQLRRLLSKIEGIESDLRTKTANLHTELGTITNTVNCISKEQKNLALRVHTLESDAQRAKGWQSGFAKIAVGVILLIVGALIQILAGLIWPR